MLHHSMQDYMAHGYCFAWEPALVWLHVISDIVIGLAYYSIPVALFYFVYKRRDVPFLSMFILLGVVFFSCGTTHLFAAATVFTPRYWEEGFVKVFTAVISAATAFLFIPLLPKAIEMPSLTRALDEIKMLNKTLEKQVSELRIKEDALKSAIVRAEDEKARADSIIAAIGDGITIQDRDFRILYQNQAAKNFMGDHIGELCYVVYEKRNHRCEGCPVARVFEDGEIHTVVRSVPTDKGMIYFENTASPLLDSKGNIIAGIEVVRNITERKRTEEAIEQQKQFTETLIRNSAVATFVLDAQHTVLIWNRACEELTGIPAFDMIGTTAQWKPFYDHEQPVLADIVMEDDTERLSSLYPVYSKSLFTSNGLHAERWFKNLNGRNRYIVFDAAPIYNSEGKVIAAIETLQDITAIKVFEEELKASEEKFRTLFEFADDSLFILDMKGNIMALNTSAHEHLGYSKDELLYKNISYIDTPESAASAPEHLEQIKKYGKAVFEAEHYRKDGTIIYIEVNAKVIDYEGKKALFSINRDITERKLAQKELNDRIHQAALSAAIGIAFTRGGDLQTTLQACAEAIARHLDAAFARIWTLNEREQVLEMQASAGMYTHINGAHGRVPVGKFKIGLIAEERKSHLTNQVIGDPRVGDQEWAIKEGMVAFAGYPLIVQDKLVGVMAMFSRNQIPDATMSSLASVADVIALGIERKRTEEMLASYSEELTALNTASNTLMILTGLKDIFQEICDTIYAVFDLTMVWIGTIEEGSYEVNPVAHSGYEDGYLATIRVTWDDSPTGMGPSGMAIKTKAPFLVHVDDPSFAPWREEAKKRGYVMRMAVPLMYARDRCIGVLNFYSGNPDYFTPDRIRLCQIFANQAAVAIENARLVEELEGKVIERTKKLEETNWELQNVNRELVLRREEADSASKSKTDFLATMSHELRTPLNAILGFSDIIRQGMAGPLTDTQKEFLADISSSGNHLLTLITDILDLSKIEAGKLELELSSFSLKELIDASLVMFKEKALKHEINVTSDIDTSITIITADQRKLKQVLVNLLSNAFKFTPDGGSVHADASRVDGIGDFIEISVTDTGIGISEENQQRLFQPFQQIETSLTRKYAGTGLGLSLCRRLIELHGGKIWVESKHGKGSRFAFIIPMKR